MPNTSISFPLSPTQGQQYTYGSTTYIYDGTSWSVDSTLLASPLKLDSTNNRVGINNNAPTVALDVTGAIKGSTTLQITGATTLSNILNVTGATTLSSTLNVSNNLTVDTNTFFVDSTNNRVGIGTASPSACLQIASSTGVIFGSTAGSFGTSSITTVSPASPVSSRFAFGTDNSGWQYRIAKNNSGTITDLVTVQDNGHVGIGTTTPVTTLDLGTGGQIKFPSTQNPSTDANILDHYAEGSWTPKLQFATQATGALSDPAGLTYTTQAGQYVKIGKLVECVGRITINATGTNGVSTSWLVITGLPFLPDTSVLVYSGGLNTLYSNANVGLRTTIGGYITTAGGVARIILTHAAITTATGTPDTVSNIALVGTTADMLTSAYPAGKDLIFKITYIAES